MPLVNKTFDQLLDFTRTTSGTFVGSNGLIQTTPASANLLTWTQQFDNAAWTKSNTTVTANSTVAPDGTSTADTLVETATSGAHSVGETVTVLNATVYTASAYVKAAERTFVAMYAGTPGQGTIFNLSNGTVHGPLVAPPTSSSITAAGNGWYRVTITYTSTSTSTAPSLYLCDGTAQFSYTGDGTSGAYVWGAQLEAASAASTYTRNNGGVFPPRFDYDPVTLAPKGLLIEEQRTNLTVDSVQMTTNWSSDGVANMVPNATTSPDGAVNASQLQYLTNGYRYLNVATTVSTVYAFSVFAKLGTGGNGTVRIMAAAKGATFNLNTQAITALDATSASITPAGNGWFRCTVVITAASTLTLVEATMPGTFTSGQGHYFWGAQLEAGAFATSYIPTVASQVTRTADVCSIVAPNFASWYNQSEGTFVANVQRINSAALSWAGELLGAVDNSMRIRLGTDARIQSIDAGVVQVDTQIQGSILANPSKYAMAYAVNNYAGSADGGAVATDTSGTVPVVSSLVLGSTSVTNLYLRSIRYYPTRLSDAQLQALTA